MPMDLQTVLYRISTEVIRLDKARAKVKEPVDYQDLREAMLVVHGAWQSFMASVRDHREPALAAEAAVQVAAAATKLATDLGGRPPRPVRRQRSVGEVEGDETDE